VVKPLERGRVVFTGLIADLGSVSAFEPGSSGAALRVRSKLARELAQGDSIAVNGVCLTASSVERDEFGAEIMAETLARSSLTALRPGTQVNLELPLRLSDRLGGHLVQGHVDGTGTVVDVHEDGFSRALAIEVEEPLERYLVEKGSVAVDGVSLTVSALHDRGFAVSLVPETLRRTNLAALRAGAVVNIEADILAKHLERLLEERALPAREVAPS
jgi:riboflavin synthase